MGIVEMQTTGVSNTHDPLHATLKVAGDERICGSGRSRPILCRSRVGQKTRLTRIDMRLIRLDLFD